MLYIQSIQYNSIIIFILFCISFIKLFFFYFLFIYSRRKLLPGNISCWKLSSFDQSQHNPFFSVKCDINRCSTHCAHAQFQVHNHTQNLMMTPHQTRANCQPPHTQPVSEKSCGFVKVHRGGRHYHTATKTD